VFVSITRKLRTLILMPREALTDEEIDRVAALAQLTEVRVTGVRRVTPAQVDRLRRLLPAARVVTAEPAGR